MLHSPSFLINALNSRHPVRLGVQLVLQLSYLLDEILCLIFSNLSPAAAGDKGLLQGTHKSFQIIYVVLELEIKIPEPILFFFFHYFVQ